MIFIDWSYKISYIENWFAVRHGACVCLMAFLSCIKNEGREEIMSFQKSLLVLSLASLLIALGGFSAQAIGGSFYYGVENDPCHSSYAERLRDGLHNASVGPMILKRVPASMQVTRLQHLAQNRLGCQRTQTIFMAGTFASIWALTAAPPKQACPHTTGQSTLITITMV